MTAAWSWCRRVWSNFAAVITGFPVFFAAALGAATFAPVAAGLDAMGRLAAELLDILSESRFPLKQGRFYLPITVSRNLVTAINIYDTPTHPPPA
jgi:hypothetical protein